MFPSSWDFYADMAAGGWVGIAIPEAYGEGGQGIAEAASSSAGRRIGRRNERPPTAPHDVRAEPGREIR